MLSRALILRASSLSPVERMVKRSRLFRSVVNRFIAGDTLESSLEACKPLLEKRIRITLDYLGENTSSQEEANQAVATYSQMLEAVAKFPLTSPANGANPALKPCATLEPTLNPSEPMNISIKLTQCGLDQGEEFCEHNLRGVLWRAEEHKNFVRIDMESSAYTERTMAMFERVFLDYKNVGVVLQSYLFRNDEDVQRIIDLQARCRLVKGAYLEPESVAYKDKSKVDEAYVRQAKLLLSKGFYPAIATQDEKIIQELKAYVKQENIDPSRFEFQMLYGIRRDIQESLVQDGFNVRVYVPFGDSWYPYFSRRLAERPANVLFILKALMKG